MDPTKAEQELQRRRRLIQASAGLPIIATLMPNAAAAMSSVTCGGGEFSNKKFLMNGRSWYGDKGVRVVVKTWKSMNKGSMGHEVFFRLPTSFPTDPSVVAAAVVSNGGDPKLASDNLNDTLTLGEILYDKTGRPYTVTSADVAPGKGYPGTANHETVSAVLVFIERDPDTGTSFVAGLYPIERDSSEDVFAVTGSCLASIAQFNGGSAL